MVLLTDDRYDNAAGAWLGISSIEEQIGIVTIGTLTGPRFTFAHELGHGLFLNHNRLSNGGDFNYSGTEHCSFGWRFEDQDEEERRTLMAVLPNNAIIQGKSRILNYSNPDIEYNGTPTGDQYNANAFRMSGRMCETADFFQDEELEIFLDGPSLICDGSADYEAVILSEPSGNLPGSPPYTFTWWKNYTGFFNILNGPTPPGEYLGNTQSITVYTPENETFWICVFVCGSGGVCVNRVMKVTALSPCAMGGGGEEERPQTGIPAGLTTPGLMLSPNPAQDRLKVRFNLPFTGLSDYDIVNSTGQKVISGVWNNE